MGDLRSFGMDDQSDESVLFIYRKTRELQPISVRRCFAIANKELQINEEIRDKEVRLIGDDGEQLGILPIQQAQDIAVEKGMDLVRIAPQAKPPDCKIMDDGKFRFEQAKREKQSKVVEKIAEAAEVEIPEAMIKYNQERIMNEMSQRMMYQGLQMEQYLQLMGTTKEEFLERVKPDAIARIKTSLVLEAVAAAENIVASDDDVDAEIQDMATQYQMKPEELKDMIGAPELENIKKDIASRKALEFLGENCKEV